ncbi:hypothetical protein PAGL106935_25840 [Paenibacillus glucanolyticus]|jgi:hypothetical protein
MLISVSFSQSLLNITAVDSHPSLPRTTHRAVRQGAVAHDVQNFGTELSRTVNPIQDSFARGLQCNVLHPGFAGIRPAQVPYAYSAPSSTKSMLANRLPFTTM